ncbi:AsnC family transcriptional regulator [Roseivirga pacifica]|uniref:Transcriptional regulator, AsnC family n=1 Tax=Roseivirga pacifica TaxID=1267423 RepID=A0A1I0R662_9BACT|nr:Lrp/AsnC ligand binding domain-containing protein [Roseivirga pacifica]MCO6358455.1 winged helix-turn-helix transcriptional regulator [Roseivirga pacifica]MCO6369010.1 winged helix-turn-helix transcriptional regulator [Roseivirga pacifica]MCO6372286.1 winged helix-turn-helix transcriptional regulator [Roseivirga pacifica]MCO6374186.1 winged helix-turn-helix transcriptional regulator [Roseivirga pacifica]MCO6381017.1 winged helix-turn-helix transcriptional regulator [Roseivirga pacifica]
MPDNYEIDNVDLSILSLLQHDAKKPYTEIAKKAFVSSGTVHVRMNKLEKMGIVKGASLDLNLAKLGYTVGAFLGVFLAKSSLYEKVANQLKKIPEITSIHYTTGNYSMFVRIYAKSTDHLKDILHDKIQKVEGIERTETFIILEETLSRSIQLDQ